MDTEHKYFPESHERIINQYIIDCRRHAKKVDELEGDDDNRGLNEVGMAQAGGITYLKPPYNSGDCFTSEIVRTKQTAEMMQVGRWQKGSEIMGLPIPKIITSKRLGSNEFWGKSKGEFLEKYRQLGGSKGEQWYLDFKDKKPFDEIISPEEAGASYASIILGLVNDLETTKKLNKASNISKTLISHDLMMHPFLYYTIGDQIENDDSLTGNDFMEKIGGPIKSSEGFIIRLEKNEENIIATLSLRGKEYSLNLDKLHELVDKYKKNWEEVDDNKQLLP